MYPLLSGTCRHNIHIKCVIYRSLTVDTTGVRLYISPVSPLNFPNKSIMIYDPTSPYFSRTDVKCFLFLWSSEKNISWPLNDPTIPITKADPDMMYYSCFDPYCTWDHSSEKLSASNIIGTLSVKLILVTCIIIFRHPRENFQTIPTSWGI